MVTTRTLSLLRENERVVHRASDRPAPDGVICAYATGRHRDLLAISSASFVAYADRWGWDLVMSSESRLHDGRPASWAKVRLIGELLEEYEWVWCIDADAIVVDLTRNVRTGLDLSGGVWLAHHPQEHDPQAVVPNAGVILARRSPETLEFFDEVWAMTQYIEHNWWENAAILDLLGHSLEAPYPVERTTRWQHLVRELDVTWNAVPGYIDVENYALAHHARADHDDFDRRAAGLLAELLRSAAADSGTTDPGTSPPADSRRWLRRVNPLRAR